MFNLLKFWLVVVVVALSAILNTAFAFDQDDFQYRFADCFDWKINNNLGMYLYQEYNLGDNAGNFYCHVHEIGAVYSGLAKWLDLSAAYVKVYGKSNGEWLDDNIPYLAGTLKWNIKDWSISDKNRFEFDQKQKSEDNWYYRNFVVVTAPIKLTRFDIQPFIANETFYSFDEGYLTGDEFRSGVNFKIVKNVSGSLYYLVGHSHNHSDNENSWKRNKHVVATQINISF